MMCNEVISENKIVPFSSYHSAESILEWLNDNMLEIITVNNFTTVTIETKTGPRAFRVSGPNSMFDAIEKAKMFKEAE